jgi:outer membrane protein assembly factor BamB
LNNKRFILLVFLMLGALSLSACAGAGGRGSTWPGLAADSDFAYLSDGAQVYGVRLIDGSETWHYPEKPDAKTVFYATPAILPDGRVLIGSAGSDNCLHVIEPSTIDAETRSASGRCFFAGAQDHWIASPLVIDGVAYTPNNDGFLYAIDLTDGSLLWSLEIGSHLWATPASDGEKLYLSSLDHNVYAIDIQDRQVDWKTGLGGSIPGSPALSLDGKTLFIGSFAAKVFALDTQTGAIQWERDTQGWVWGGPVVSEQAVYVGDLDGLVYALDAATGNINWTVQPDGPVTGSPLLTADGIVVTTESGSVYVIGSDGGNVWVGNIDGKVYTSAVQSGDLVLAAPLPGSEFFLSAFNDGRLVWSFKPEN